MERRGKMKKSRLTLALGLLAALSTPLAALAEDVVVDWEHTFWLEGSGSPYENPVIRVGFNPQPEPPGAQWATLDLRPAEFILAGTVDEGPADGMRILFGVCNVDPLCINATGEPAEGQYEFEVTDSAAGKVFDVCFEMGTDSGGLTTDWYGFNPQPEPPGLDQAAAIGFDFQFDSYSRLWLQCQVLDRDADPISFRLIPEPTTLALLALGGIAVLRRRAANTE
jgi:hypothetical protein